MAQPAGSDHDTTIMGLDVFWPLTTANPPMRCNDWLTNFHVAALAKEALHVDTINTAEALTPAPPGRQQPNRQHEKQPTTPSEIQR